MYVSWCHDASNAPLCFSLHIVYLPLLLSLACAVLFNHSSVHSFQRLLLLLTNRAVYKVFLSILRFLFYFVVLANLLLSAAGYTERYKFVSAQRYETWGLTREWRWILRSWMFLQLWRHCSSLWLKVNVFFFNFFFILRFIPAAFSFFRWFCESVHYLLFLNNFLLG